MVPSHSRLTASLSAPTGTTSRPEVTSSSHRVPEKEKLKLPEWLTDLTSNDLESHQGHELMNDFSPTTIEDVKSAEDLVGCPEKQRGRTYD